MGASSKNRESCNGRFDCLIQIMLLVGLLPLSVLFAVVSYLKHLVCSRQSGRRAADGVRPSYKEADWVSTGSRSGRSLLVPGAKYSKALHVIRALKRSGFAKKIVLTETRKYSFSGARFSVAADGFEVTADPRDSPDQYVRDLFAICEKHGCDAFLPVSLPAASVCDSQAQQLMFDARQDFLPLHVDTKLCMLLDDKNQFCIFCREIGLPAPRTVHLESNADVRGLNQSLQSQRDGFNQGARREAMILKNLAYDPLHRLDLFEVPCPEMDLEAYLSKLRNDGSEITSKQPWIAQTRLRGQEFSAAIVIRDGKLRAFTVSTSSASQLNFQHTEHTGIEAWVREFVAKAHIQNGQLCFDFIVDDDTGAVMPIECNPRIHSQMSVFNSEVDQACLGAALLSAGESVAASVLKPTSNHHATFYFGNEIFKLLGATPLLASIGGLRSYNSAPAGFFSQLRTTLSRFSSEREADFDLGDPLPFFVRLHLQLPSLLLSTFVSGKAWHKLDFCIGKVVEVGGD